MAAYSTNKDIDLSELRSLTVAVPADIEQVGIQPDVIHITHEHSGVTCIARFLFAPVVVSLGQATHLKPLLVFPSVKGVIVDKLQDLSGNDRALTTISQIRAASEAQDEEVELLSLYADVIAGTAERARVTVEERLTALAVYLQNYRVRLTRAENELNEMGAAQDKLREQIEARRKVLGHKNAVALVKELFG